MTKSLDKVTPGVSLTGESVLVASHLDLSYAGTPILRGVNLRVAAGESVAVMGPSGSGKSSLLLCLAGLEPPTSGTVMVASHDVWSQDAAARASLRLHRFGFVFQNADLVPELSLLDNVALPGELVGLGRTKALDRAGMLLDRLGVGPEARRRPGAVSGGQRQRAAVARSVMVGPAVVFADEPTGALDSDNAAVVLDLLLQTVRSSGASLVVVTHDPRVASRTDRTIGLLDGQIVGRRAVSEAGTS